MNKFVREKFTLAWLEKHVKAVDGCLIWVRSFTPSGQPRACFFTPEGIRSTRIRRLVWESANECDAPENLWAAVTCGSPGCVHPDHVVMRSVQVAVNGSIRSRVKTTAFKGFATKQLHGENDYTNPWRGLGHIAQMQNPAQGGL